MTDVCCLFLGPADVKGKKKTEVLPSKRAQQEMIYFVFILLGYLFYIWTTDVKYWLLGRIMGKKRWTIRFVVIPNSFCSSWWWSLEAWKRSSYFYSPARSCECECVSVILSRVSAAPGGSWPWRAACPLPFCVLAENGQTSCSSTTRRTSPSSEDQDQTTT